MNQFLFFILIAITLSGCAGCSRSGNRTEGRHSRASRGADLNGANERVAQPVKPDAQPTLAVKGDGPNQVVMEQENGVYKIPVTVNGVSMRFILDTGASLISMSATEAAFLYKQGTITAQDILGTVQFADANGDISPGTIIRLRTVRIGNRTLENVQASVVDNAVAPLLLGQSALAQFGKLSIDYKQGIVEFE